MNAEPDLRKPDRYKASSLKAYNARMVDRYDSVFWHRVFRTSAWDQEILAEIGPECPSLRVLDIGCATGRLLCRLAEAGVGRLYGTDLAPNILEAARRKLARHNVEAELKPADAEDALPWPDGAFDVAVLSGVFHHFYRPLDALAEIHRLLAPGGRIIVVEPRFPAIIRQILNGWMFLFPHDGDCSFRSPKGIASLLRSARFGQTHSRRIARFAYLVAGGKTIPLTGSA